MLGLLVGIALVGVGLLACYILIVAAEDLERLCGPPEPKPREEGKKDHPNSGLT